MSALPTVFTDPFALAYRALTESDVASVDDMLDRLEQEHATAVMRGQIRIGEHTLFTTPRIYADEGVYRITWYYDDRRSPTAIMCVSVASVET